MSDHTNAKWKPKAILFDLLTALLDSWSTWTLAVLALPKITPESANVLALTWRNRYLELTFGCGAYVSYESLVAQSAQDVGLHESAAELLLQKWETLEPWPEVRNVLEKLRGKGYKLGVVTNCSRELGSKAADRVGTEFDAVVTAEEAGYVDISTLTSIMLTYAQILQAPQGSVSSRRGRP